MKKKILFVITKSNWGGAQRYVYDLATHLPKEYEPVVAGGGGGLLFKKLKEHGIRTISIPGLERDISFVKEWPVLFFLIQLFKKEKPDIVHLNSSKIGGEGALTARIAGVSRIIFTAHGWAFNESVNPLSKSFRWIASYVTALFAHRVIAVSEYDKKHSPIPSKTIRIYNGIDVNFSLGSGDIIRNSFPKGAHITGTIGELTKNKNQIALIEQAKNNPTMYVAIVGDGEDHDFLTKKIEEYGLTDRVKLFGFMPAHEVLRGFDVFSLPSLKEGLPYVLLEAKAAGLPVVASRVGGVGEILDAKDMNEFSFEQMVQKTIAVYESKI